ncbi:MAG TPA: exonuclease SbcCD subunit D C-terminal domain-containing protein [Kofleriaceae bacterium]|nr:exonuclease SbcCD subunit D C-terminal domain-containing protein [Kofleriaceae bacterium]
MRLIHTSDWHLGHMLRGEVGRELEHEAFLAWLLEQCAAEAADALVITGDVFDTATPPASAERMWFEFLAAARRARPAMDIIAIAGNHDSPARLGASSAVLRELGVHVIGGLPRAADGALDLDRILIPVAGGRGLVAAVPFLRPVDTPADVDDPLAAVYGDVVAAARERRAPDQALIVTGHLYVAGADAQFLSERRVSIGGQESAPLRLFPDEISYTALGHIHRPQRVGRDTIRYAGAPIALSLDEVDYKHQALAIDFDGARVAQIRALPVPRVIEIVRVPRRGAAPLAEVLDALRALPPATETSDERSAAERGRSPRGIDPMRPFLEVVVALERPEPKLRALVEAALEGRRARLVYLHVEQTGDRATLGDRVAMQRLAELDPRDVFVRLWARGHAEPPGEAVLAAFDRLLSEVSGDVEDLA